MTDSTAKLQLEDDLDRQPKHGHDAVHRLVLPAYRAGAVRFVVPEAGAGGVQAGTVLLHDHTGDDIFVGFLQLGQHAEAGLHHRASPVVHLVVLVRIAADGGLDRFLDNLAHIIHDELVLFPAVIHDEMRLIR